MRFRCTPLLVLALVGCGSSPPTRFYSLEPTAVQDPIKVAVQTPLKVDAVHVPTVLDRKTMVTGEANYRLKISSQDRWGGDFGEMVQRVLTQDLQSRLPAGMIIAPDAPAPANAHGLVVDILSFAPDSAGAVALDADWAVVQGSPPQPAQHGNLKLSEPFDGSAASQASAMSKLIGRLADKVAQALGAAPSGADK